jgi:thiol-disulfide isomerase/thioredoxin
MRRGGTNTRKSHKSHSNLPLAVGKIFSNNCGHCIAMAQDWTKLENQNSALITKDTNIEASEMDTKLPALKAKYNIDFEFEGYPTIYKIIKSKNGVNTVVLYEGSRTTQAMQNWISGKV